MTRILVLLLALSSPVRGTDLSGEALDGPDSAYTGWLVQVLKSWAPSRPRRESAASLMLTCLATASDDRYVGMLQQMNVDAPLATVEEVMDDVRHYKDLFPGVVDVHVVPESRHGARYITAWEQRVPVFFLPNVTYELATIVDRTHPGRRVYRYKLLRGASMLASDGMVVLESLGPARTQFTEYDFFNAEWGPLPASSVWRESLRGAFLSDMAIKLRAENAGWSFDRIATEAAQQLDLQPEQIEQCYRERRTTDLRVVRNSPAYRTETGAPPIAP